jgi:beta-glucosidase
MNKTFLVLIFLAFLCPNIFSQSVLPYKNPDLPIDIRVKDLLSRMSPEEKFWQLFMIPGDLDNAVEDQYKNGIFGFQVSASAKNDAGGQMMNYSASDNALTLAKKINQIQKYFVEQSRLGIPIIAFDEGLHGILRGGATAFPQAIALAATWDTLLMHDVATAIAEETQARGIRDILSPVINIASDPRWGRVEETYGEDPYLVSRMAVAFTGAFERKNIITTPKHFIANVGDGGRDSYPIHFNERLLEEIYFPPFKACFSEAGSRSVMTAYNSLDGTACFANSWLLEKKLKGEWGFKGLVISDANAVGGEVVLHHTAEDYAGSGKHAIENGLDVIFQTDYTHYKLFQPHFLDGMIDTNKINNAVSRVLTAKFELGLFEHPYTSEGEAEKWLDNKSHKAVALRASLESIVLLRNEKELLPLNKSVHGIAVIGDDAVKPKLGGYSGPGNHPVSIMQGIQERAGSKTQIIYEPGCGIETTESLVIPNKYLSTTFDGNLQAGLKAEYFNNVNFIGEPVVSKLEKEIDFHWTLGSPDKSIHSDFFSARWTGQLRSPGNGRYKIGLEGDDGYRLYIDNKLVIDNWIKQSYRTKWIGFNFGKDRVYDIKIEFFEPRGNGQIKLIWNAGVEDNWNEKIAKAVLAVQKSDVAVIVAGIREGEFQDRASLQLPGHQEEMIRRIAATGKPVVVLLVGGSAITMTNWLDSVNSVLNIWYPGEEGGNAVAQVLFGDYNPAGRLPITFPVLEAQLPLVYNHKPTGRGDDYNNLSGLPLFPFGFGLSYTAFSYHDIELSKNNIDTNTAVLVHCKITNTGKRDGDEVVQLYLHKMLSSVAQPVIELKGFQRIQLHAGEIKEISFTITSAMLTILDKNMRRVVEPGEYQIMLGASSADIRLKEILNVK